MIGTWPRGTACNTDLWQVPFIASVTVQHGTARSISG